MRSNPVRSSWIALLVSRFVKGFRRQSRSRKPVTYFHCAPVQIPVGTIIQPGNHGNKVQATQPVANNVNVLFWRESVLEIARMLLAPTRPSRLACNFVLYSLAEADRYRGLHCNGFAVHEVELNYGQSLNAYWRLPIGGLSGCCDKLPTSPSGPARLLDREPYTASRATRGLPDKSDRHH